MEKLKKLEKYVIVPRINFYGGFKFDGRDILLCNDHDFEETKEGKNTYDFKVKQKIKDNILYTDIKKEYDMQNGKRVRETANLEIELEVGQLLVYVEGTGFTIPEYNMCLIDEAIGQYKLLRDINKGVDINDTKGNEKESI